MFAAFKLSIVWNKYSKSALNGRQIRLNEWRPKWICGKNISDFPLFANNITIHGKFSIYQHCWDRSGDRMNDAIIVAIITASGSLLVAAATFYFTKRHELFVQWQKEKLNHYKVLLSALSDLAVDGTDKDDANRRFSLAVNTIALAAPQDVISALMAFHDEAKSSNPNKTPERHDELLKKVLLAVRRDIGLAKGDDAQHFKFHLIGSAPVGDPNNCVDSGPEKRCHF